jgi:hypothetical protein
VTAAIQGYPLQRVKRWRRIFRVALRKPEAWRSIGPGNRNWGENLATGLREPFNSAALSGFVDQSLTISRNFESNPVYCRNQLFAKPA